MANKLTKDKKSKKASKADDAKTKKSKKAAAEAPIKPKKKGFPIAKGDGTKKKKKKKPIPTFTAPADFKPHFLLLQFKTEKDSLIATNVKATRYQGRFDRDADDKKKFNLGAYDMVTLMALAARVSAVTYKASNDKKMPVDPSEREGLKGSNRLPPSTTFQVLLRVGRKKEGNVLTGGVKQIWQAVESKKTGRLKLEELEKTDPAYRLIRKVRAFLPAAFTQVQMPPKRSRKKASDEDSDD
jgi:hypothetical protein